MVLFQCHDGSDEHDCFYDEYWRNGNFFKYVYFCSACFLTMSLCVISGQSWISLVYCYHVLLLNNMLIFWVKIIHFFFRTTLYVFLTRRLLHGKMKTNQFLNVSSLLSRYFYSVVIIQFCCVLAGSGTMEISLIRTILCFMVVIFLTSS